MIFRGIRGVPEYIRFWSQVDKSGDCWLWLGSVSKQGYGKFSGQAHKDVKGKTWRAHRWAYQHLIGQIPEGLTIDHLCRNKLCVNPAHMEVVTVEENVARRPLITHCKNGHAFSVDNTVVWSKQRVCKTCLKLWHDRQNKARRLARQAKAQASAPSTAAAVEVTA